MVYSLVLRYPAFLSLKNEKIFAKGEYHDDKESMGKRSMGNRALLWAYALLYLAVSAVFLAVALNTITLHPSVNWMRWTAGFGLVFFVAAAAVYLGRYFPVSSRWGALLFVPYVINGIYFFLSRSGKSALILSLILDSITIFEGVVLGIFLSVIFGHWSGEDAGGGGAGRILRSLRQKARIIREEPVIIAGLAVLLLPVTTAVYYFIMGYLLKGEITARDIPLWLSRVLYCAAIANVAFFHYRGFRRY